MLPKGCQISSRILTGTKYNLKAIFQALKERTTAIGLELVKVGVWKNNDHFKIYSAYNPPNNIPSFEVIEVQPKTIIIGDFNAHSEE